MSLTSGCFLHFQKIFIWYVFYYFKSASFCLRLSWVFDYSFGFDFDLIFYGPSFNFLWFAGLELLFFLWILSVSGLRIGNGRFFGALKVVLRKHCYNLLFGRVGFTSVVKSIPWLRHFDLSVGNWRGGSTLVSLLAFDQRVNIVTWRVMEGMNQVLGTISQDLPWFDKTPNPDHILAHQWGLYRFGLGYIVPCSYLINGSRISWHP